MKRFFTIQCKYHDLGVVMSDLFGRFAFKHLSIGDQHFAVFWGKFGEFGQNVI